MNLVSFFSDSISLFLFLSLYPPSFSSSFLPLFIYISYILILFFVSLISLSLLHSLCPYLPYLSLSIFHSLCPSLSFSFHLSIFHFYLLFKLCLFSFSLAFSLSLSLSLSLTSLLSPAADATPSNEWRIIPWGFSHRFHSIAIYEKNLRDMFSDLFA